MAEGKQSYVFWGAKEFMLISMNSTISIKLYV